MAAESGLEGPDLTGDIAGGDVDTGAATVVDLDAGLRDAAALRAAAERRARMAAHETMLRETPQSVGFFQAVRLLEKLYPDRARVGGFDDPSREVVRFGVTPRLSFPASEIQELELRDDAPSSMRVNFFGLTGPQGVLPHAYTMLVQERIRERDYALLDFLDLFHHRIISLFYQAWRKHRFTVAREDGARDHLKERLLDVIGLATDTTRNRLAVADEALVFRAGLLAPQPRGAASLEQLIEDYYDVPADIEQFVGGWYGVSTRDRCVIGEDDDPCNVLGGAVVGDEVRDVQARVRIRLGPLTRAQYDAFLPGGSAHRELASLVRFYCHDQLEFDVQLVLEADEVPPLRLGDPDDAPRLGWASWIRSGQRESDADETILTLGTGTR